MDLATKLREKEAQQEESATMHLASRRDINDILRLLYDEGWVEFGRNDIEFMLETSPRSCFKFICDGHLIGVTFATELPGNIFYPNSILIDRRYRHRVAYYEEGIRFLAYCKELSRHEVIYAALRLVGAYEQLGGYEYLCTYSRLLVKGRDITPDPENARELREDELPEVADFARSVYHSEREHLFRYFLERGARAFVARNERGEVEGFAMVRALPRTWALGPVLATSDGAAARVMAAAGRVFPEEQLQINGEENRLQRFLKDHGITWEDEQARMAKMTRGDSSILEDEERIYGIFSHYIS